MIAWVINQWRKGICQHEWQDLGVCSIYKNGDDAKNGLPIEKTQTFRCKKCGQVNRVEL